MKKAFTLIELLIGVVIIGILGKIKEKSWTGRKHRGGGDVLVHAQTGEGLFSRKEVANMGGEGAFMNFKNLLARPLRERPIPLSGAMFQGFTSTAKLEEKVDNLTKIISDKKEIDVHWETLRERDYMVITTMEKGIKDIVKHELKRPRI